MTVHVKKKILVTQMFGICRLNRAIMIFDNMDEKEEKKTDFG